MQTLAILSLWVPLLVPNPAPDSPAPIRELVWPALRGFDAARGWTPRPVDVSPPGDAPAIARAHRGGGVLWAEPDGDAVRLRLYRAADDRIFEATLELPAGAAPAAVVDAVRLKLDYLLEARGGRPWRRVPPLPPPTATIPDAHRGDLVPPPRPAWPRRPPPAVPDPPPPLPAPAGAQGTEVEVLRRDPEPGGIDGWGAWFTLGAVADSDAVEPGFVLGVRRRLVERWSLRVQGGAYPFGGDGATVSALQLDLALGYRLWRAPLLGDAWLGGFYGHLRADAPATASQANRGGALVGMAFSVPVSGPLAVGVQLDLLAGSNALEATLGDTRVARHAPLQTRAGVFLSLSADETGGPTARSKESR